MRVLYPYVSNADGVLLRNVAQHSQVQYAIIALGQLVRVTTPARPHPNVAPSISMCLRTNKAWWASLGHSFKWLSRTDKPALLVASMNCGGPR